MSRMNEMWHGTLKQAQEYLEADSPDLQETQCALINAIDHIRQLEARMDQMQSRINDLALSCTGRGK